MATEFRFLLAPVDPVTLVLADVCERTTSATDGIELLLGSFLRGAKGDKGDKGDPGERGGVGPSGGDTYLHEQAIPASVWTIHHNLGRFPSVSVVDSAGSEIEGDVRWVDANNVVVTFAYPFGGRAFLN